MRKVFRLPLKGANRSVKSAAETRVSNSEWIFKTTLDQASRAAREKKWTFSFFPATQFAQLQLPAELRDFQGRDCKFDFPRTTSASTVSFLTFHMSLSRRIRIPKANSCRHRIKVYKNLDWSRTHSHEIDMQNFHMKTRTTLITSTYKQNSSCFNLINTLIVPI